ncbi:MAG TPA: type II toxin-antitoxin system prevent-host-death family antitoxin [Terriglobia bacterium]|nr:type II toxin-antitoxin system prevent-host-death family antitoxin [Terriglobia bacterium]
MKSISIRELHEKTGEWVRKSEKFGGITVTDRGRKVARIIPIENTPTVNLFAARKLRKGYSRMLGSLNRGTNSTKLISEDRDRT